jgi:outer membrane protease
MSMSFLRALTLSGAVLASFATPAFADDQQHQTTIIGADDFVFVGGIGYTWLKGNELVYNGGNRISRLIWESDAPVINLGAKGVFDGDWTVSGDVRFGFGGNSHMEDYDWLGGSYDFDDWTDRSVHPDTDLDRYIDLDIALGKNFALSEASTFNLHGGFKYTNVKWTGYGGSYVYSSGGFRNTTGTFADGEKVITFEQRYPGLFIGGEVKTTSGAWTIIGLARAGATIGASDTDHHWLNDQRFEEKYGAIPFVDLGLEAAYQVNDNSQFTLGVDFERFFRKKGSTKEYDISSGAQIGGPFEDGAGMDFQSITVSADLKVAF